MNKEVVIIKRILIDKPNQLSVFDIKIPRQAKKIIGIEMGLRWLTGTAPTEPLFNSSDGFFKINRNTTVGELKLQSYDSAKVFYTNELIIFQNFTHSDFTSSGFKPSAFTHQTQSTLDPIQITENPAIVQGIYKDILKPLTAFSYSVNIYVWLENK